MSDEDAVSALSVEKLEKLPTESERTVFHLQNSGHGTTMFEKDPEFMRIVLNWLKQYL